MLLTDLLVDVLWKRYLLFLTPKLMSQANSKSPGKDYIKLKKGAVCLIKDRISSKGKLDLGIIVARIKPAEGDTTRRYWLKVALPKRNTEHPYPLTSQTTKTNLLERTGQNLIYLGHPVDDFHNMPLLIEDHLLDEVLYNREAPGKFKNPPKQKQYGTTPFQPGTSSDDEDFEDNEPFSLWPDRGCYPMHRQRTPWLYESKIKSPKVKKVVKAKGTKIIKDKGKKDTLILDNTEDSENTIAPSVPSTSKDMSTGNNSASNQIRTTSSPLLLSSCYTTVNIDKDGHCLYLALATSNMLFNSGRILTGARNNLARDSRKLTYEHIISLTHDTEKLKIFGLDDCNEEIANQYLTCIRDIATEFTIKTQMHKCPNKFIDRLASIGDGKNSTYIVELFDNSILQFISSALRQQIFVNYIEGRKQILYKYEGFCNITNDNYSNNPALIELGTTGKFRAAKIKDEFKQILLKINTYQMDPSLIVDHSAISTAIKVLQIKAED